MSLPLDFVANIAILSVHWAHESLVVHGHGPPQSRRQPKHGKLVDFIIFMRTHPTPLLSTLNIVFVSYGVLCHRNNFFSDTFYE